MVTQRFSPKMYSVENDSIFVFLYFHFIIPFFFTNLNRKSYPLSIKFKKQTAFEIESMARRSKNVMSCYRRGGGGGGVGVGVLPTTCTQGFATSRMHIYI